MKTRIVSLSLLLTLALAPLANAIDFNVMLDSAQEIPAPSIGDFTPSGMSTVTVDTITGEVSVAGSFSGLTTAAAAAHLTVWQTAVPRRVCCSDFRLTRRQAGNLSGTGVLDAAQLTGLLNGNTYLNLHTSQNGPGEIRGQVVDSDILVYHLGFRAPKKSRHPTSGMLLLREWQPSSLIRAPGRLKSPACTKA